MNTIISQIKKCIEEYDTIIVLRHQNPDGDALGSALGLGHFLQFHFKDKTILTDGSRPPQYLNFLTNIKLASPKDYEGALVITTDTATTSRIDSEYYQLADKIIKIDHHPETDPYGDINWVDSNRIAASELVVELVKSYNVNLPSLAATALFVGIVTDSNRFLFPHTSQRTFMLTSYLVGFIPSLPFIYDNLYLTDIKSFKLRIAMMDALQISPEGVGYGVFNKHKIASLQSDCFVIKSMVNVYAGVKEIPVWMVAVYNPDLDKVKISIRSRKLDISQVAMKYNGGGHAHASACFLDNWDELPSFIKDLEEVIRENKKQILN